MDKRPDEETIKIDKPVTSTMTTEMTPEPLNTRREQLLRIVIQEYIQTAQPVGSNAIAQSYDLGVSSATIRNDLAALEKEGLLTHPHTSAGRIPTDAGYRYFVQNLLSDAELPSSERTSIRIQFRQARQDLDQWLRMSTSVLARASQAAALATTPRAAVSRYKHLELVAIHGNKVLLILVLQQGMVKQQLLDLDEPMEQDDLRRISNEVNDQLVGLGATEIIERVAALSPFAAEVAHLIVNIMHRIDRHSGSEIYRDGLVQILDAPEFAEGENIRRIVQVFETQAVLEQLVDEYNDNSDLNEIQIVISGNGRFAELRDISLVLSRYGVLDQATGLLGVIGPLRMPYGRTVGAVRFVATLMSEMVREMYGL
jgi:heat-inducible transcriptional repressor